MNLFSNYNELDETCFMCGENFDERSNNQEHFFPKWILSKYNSKLQKQGYVGIDGIAGKTDFWKQKLQVHQVCNQKFGEKLELKISDNDFNDNELWLWIMKIVCGLLFHEAKYSRKKPDFDPAILTGFQDDDLVRFWEIQNFVLGEGKFLYGVPFTVIELDYLFTDDQFFHTVNFNLGVFWIAFNRRSYLVFFNQDLSDFELAFCKEEWKQTLESEGWGSANSPMFKYKLFTARMAIEVFFARRAQVWNRQMNSLSFDRPERSQELEIEFYKLFGFEMKFHKNGTVEIRSMEDS